MQVQVRYFAAVREAVGHEAEALEVPEGTTVAALHTLLEQRHPGLARHRRGLRFAVAERFAEPAVRLGAGDEVALIPPVSGG